MLSKHIKDIIMVNNLKFGDKGLYVFHEFGHHLLELFKTLEGNFGG